MVAIVLYPLGQNIIITHTRAHTHTHTHTQMASKVYSDETGFTIYLGSADHACDLLSLEVNGITYILNTAAGDPACQMKADVYGDHYK